MNKKIWLIPVYLFLVVLIMGVVCAVTEVSFYDFNDDVLDNWGSNDGTWGGTSAYSTDYPSFDVSGDGATKSGVFDGSTTTFSTGITSLPTDFSLVIEGKIKDAGAQENILFEKNGNSGFWLRTCQGSNDYQLYVNGAYVFTTSGNYAINTWYNWIFTYVASSNTWTFYQDDVQVGTGSRVPTFGTTALRFGEKGGTAFFDGKSDNFKVFDGILTSDERTNINNCGSITCGGTSYFDITNTNSISNMTSYFNSTSYSTTNGTINTGISSEKEFTIITQSNQGHYFNTTNTNHNLSVDLSVTFIEYPRVTIYNDFTLNSLSSFNVSYDTTTINDVSGVAYLSLNETKSVTINKEDYFSKTLSHNFMNSNDLNTSLYQSIININITEMFSGNPISNWTLYNGSDIIINTSNNVGIFYPVAGEFNNLLLHSNDASFNDRNIDGFNVSVLDNKTFYYELLPTEMNVTAKNILTDVSIINFSVFYSSLNSSHSGSYSTTSGELIFGVINGDTYNITIDAGDYALYDNSILKLINGNSNHTFSLYTDNSINFEVRWEENNTLITDNVTILLTGAITTYTYNTVSGSYYADNIIDDTYSIKTSVSGLDDKYYSIAVNDRSHQDLTIYFANNYENVTFLFQDKNTGTSLEGVYFSMSRYINGSLVVVSSKLSDITGTVTAKYVSGTFYQLSGLKEGYSEKTFELNPIESDLYIVKMESASSQIFIDDGVSVYYTPKSFANGMNNFSFTINSPLGLLTDYWFNVSYPNNHNNYTGTESIGEIFDFSFNITNPSLYDNVKVEFYYLTSLGGETHLIFYHPISYINASASTWSNLKEGYDDIGIFERIIVVVLCVILVAGFGYLIGGVGGSLITGLLVYVFFVATGFIPLWSVLISLLVGLVLVLRGGSFG